MMNAVQAWGAGCGERRDSGLRAKGGGWRTRAWRGMVGAACLWFALGAWGAKHTGRCDICNVVFFKVYYTAKDVWTEQNRLICETCMKRENVCSVCRLPVLESAKAIPDGRFLCDRDAALVVLDDAEMKGVLAEARKEIDRLFSRFTKFPVARVDIDLADQLEMQMLLDTHSFDRQCPFVMGYTQSQKEDSGEWTHKIRLLRARPKGEMIGVYVHELGHAWMRENVPSSRRLAKDTEEGFCELLACRVLELMGDTEQLERVLRNNYTRGQVQLFRKADAAYDFHTVTEWMRAGVDEHLKADEPDRVKLVMAERVEKVASTPAPAVDPERVKPAPPRARLSLLGVMGVGSKAKALVNDVSLAAGDSSPVRVGTNTVAVRCVAVGTNTVVLEVGEAGERVELELGL